MLATIGELKSHPPIISDFCVSLRIFFWASRVEKSLLLSSAHSSSISCKLNRSVIWVIQVVACLRRLGFHHSLNKGSKKASMKGASFQLRVGSQLRDLTGAIGTEDQEVWVTVCFTLQSVWYPCTSAPTQGFPGVSAEASSWAWSDQASERVDTWKL